MQIKGLILVLICSVIHWQASAQKFADLQAANEKSLQLYNQYQWTSLLTYGKSCLAEGIDFPLLRMRMGYAAFMVENYSESIRQYAAVYSADKNNATAVYYLYLSNLYLNNRVGARYYASLLDPVVQEEIKLNPVVVTKIDAEYSRKNFDSAYRGNANYSRVGANLFLGHKLSVYQSIAFYNQLIQEPQLTSVTNNTAIDIRQREYYAKAEMALSGKLALLAGFHYLKTPFNNYVYNNNIGFGGLRYILPYVQLEGLVQVGSIRDSSYTQFDAVLTTYPLGNTKLYTISRASISSDFAFTQVVGFSPLKRVWLEGHATLGTYYKMLNNDAMYLYDDIDMKKSRVGGGVYVTVGKKMVISANYTHDVKIRYGTANLLINQQSITGGIQWNF